MKALDTTLSRRRLVRVIATAFGGVATLSGVRAIAQQPTPQPMMNQVPGTPRNASRTSLHQEVDFHTSPQRVFDALINAKEFTAATGMMAAIDRSAGGAFSLFDGQIVGRNVELIPNSEIVQAWRATTWAPGVYSIVRFDLTPIDTGTHLVLTQTAFPDGEFDHLDAGWPVRYWKPLAEYLGESST